MNPRDRLEDVLDLPFGAVLADSKGVRHVFVGTTRSTAGLTFHFVPDMAVYGPNPLISTYSLVEGGFRKFPGLKEYLKKCS
jgi:hypothetical protein